MSFRRFCFVSDYHGDKHDPQAASAFLRFCEQWQPEIRVFGGDLWDFRPLRKKASEDERKESMQTDFADGKLFLETYRPHFFLRGNHDERLWDLAEKADGIVGDYARQSVIEIEQKCHDMGVRLLPYHKRDGVLKIGSLKMLHGYAAGIYATRKHAWTYGSCLHGHTHTIDHATLERTEKTMARAVGCLAKLDMEFSRAQIGSLRHAHGWAYGVVDEESGHFHVFQAECVGDKFLCATELVEL